MYNNALKNDARDDTEQDAFPNEGNTSVPTYNLSFPNNIL